MAALRRRLLFELVTIRQLERQVRRFPAAERRAYAAACRYVAGETVADMLRVVAGLRDRGLAASVDSSGSWSPIRSPPSASPPTTCAWPRP